MNQKIYVFKLNFIISIFQLFFLISFITCAMVVLFFPHEKEPIFTTNIDKWFADNWTPNLRTLSELLLVNGWIIIYQSLITIAIWSFVLFWLSYFLLVRNYFKIHDFFTNKKLLIASTLIGFLMFPFWLKKSFDLDSSKDFKVHFFGEIDFKSISHANFFAAISGKRKFDKQTWATGFFYALIFSAISGFILIWVNYGFQFIIFEEVVPSVEFPDEAIYDGFVRLSPFTSRLAFYTEITNILCLVYALLLAFKPKANIFKNNTFTIQLATYMIIVGTVYWSVLFEYDEHILYHTPEMKSLNLLPGFLATVVLHGTTPLFIGIFTLLFVRLNMMKPRKYWSSWDVFIIYPLTYGIFLYMMPLFTKISIYGIFTNINPHNTIFLGTDAITGEYITKQGSPIWIIGLFVLAFAMGLFYFIFWIYSFSITYKKSVRIE